MTAAPPPRRRRLETLATVVIVTAVIGGTFGHCAYRVRRARQQATAVDGVLSVRSDPPGAHVVVEGRAAEGRTPLFVRGLKKGVPLAVEVTRDGYRPWRGSGKVRADYGDGVLLVKLEPLAGAASASAPASASAAAASAPAR